MTLIVVPVAIVIFILAYSLYSVALAELSASQASEAVARARAVGDWLDAAGRALSTEAAAAGLVPTGKCESLAESFLNRNSGVIAVRFLEGSATQCSAGPSNEFEHFDVAGMVKSSGVEGYRTAVLGTRVYIVSAAPRTAAADPSGSVLLIDPDALQQQLRASDDLAGTRIALVDGSGSDLAVDPASADRRWLPSVMPKLLDNHWRADDRAGRDSAFAIAPVPGSSLILLMRFDDRRRGQARRQLLVLSLAQVAMLGLLAFFYAGAIRRDIVRWIVGLDAAARARGGDPESRAKAPIAYNMPSELRSVAESFNAMADHVVEHQVALKTSLDQNRVLMLEMHHRIKNSLQVIQSYLALIRRSALRGEAATLTRVEARVGVIAVAYRLALTPTGIRPISVKPFLEEICGAAVASLRRPRQRVIYAIDWSGTLVVDRAIPLGLSLVEALIVAFNASDATYIGVLLQETEDGFVQLRVESDSARGETLPAGKVVVGLANQVGAALLPAAERQVAVWRFAP
jgi:two-component system, sensor histidine kinase PdtaS